MNELLQAPKDTSQSCIFDFPDRPGRPVPPVDPDNPPWPPTDYPYEPVLDWPPSPPVGPPVPGVDPIPGSNPHPYDVPEVFNEIFPFYYKGEDADPQYGGGTGLFLSSDHWNVSLGVVVHVFERSKFHPRDQAGPFLLSECGFSIEAAAPSNSISSNSGLFVFTVREGITFRQHLAYYARHFDGITGDHFIAFSPVFFTSIIGTPGPGVIIGTADFLIGPAVLLPTIGIPPAQTVATKTINTAYIYLPNEFTGGGAEANLD